MKTQYILCLLLFLSIFSYFTMLPQQTFADNDCLPLLNGGITNQQFCPTPIPQNTNLTSTYKQYSNGQPIYPSQQSTTTPDTGPGSWSLMSLFIFAGIGLLLRNKAKLDKSNKIM